jgi:hypothetical protein
VALATWAAPDANPWLGTALGVLARHDQAPAPPPGTPGLFAFADPERLRVALKSAGFAEVEVEAVPLPDMSWQSGRAYWQLLLELSAPVAVRFGKQAPAAQTVIAEEIAREAEKRRQGDKVVLAGTAWVASGMRL